MHLQRLLIAADIVAVTVEQYRDHGQTVVVAAVRFAIVQAPDVEPDQDREPGIVVAGLEELGVQLDGKIVQLFLGKNLIPYLLFGLLGGVGRLPGSIVALAGLDIQLLAFDRDLQF